MTRIALGTAQFGQDYGVANQRGQVAFAEATTIVKYASDHGIDTLDTAAAYGDSEERLGQIGISGWHAVSKLSPVPDDCSDVSRYVEDAVRDSLKRLGLHTLSALLLHRPEQLLRKGGARLYKALEQLKVVGLVRRIGVSIYEPEELDALATRFSLDIVQAPINVLDRRLIDSGWLARLNQQGTEVHGRSIFLQGLLLMRSSDRPRQFNRWQATWDRWETWLEETGLTPLQACLRYALTLPEIDKVVVGVDSLSQLTEVLASAEGPLPPVPAELTSGDRDLVDPSRWHAMAGFPAA